jgi:ligand-binding sensor domain-containing protein
MAWPESAYAQPDPTPVRAFRSFTREGASRGLPQATVVSLHEDEQGVIWIGTMGGLARVEQGAVTRLPDEDNAPPAEPLNAFARRQGGGFHVAGTTGLYTWTGSRWTQQDTPAAMMALAEDRDGRLFGITTSGLTLVRLQEAGDWIPVDGITPHDFSALAVSADGHVVVGGTRGVFELSASGLEGMMCNALPRTRTWTMRVDGARGVWAGGEGGSLCYCETGSRHWQTVVIPGWTGGRIRAMTIDQQRRVWVGGDAGNVAFGSIDTSFKRWSPANGVKGATVNALEADRTGSVWMGFNGAGLQQWIGEAWSHRTFWMEPSDTDSMYTFSLTPTLDGGFLAAVFSRGVLWWDGERMRAFGRAEGISEDVRFAIEPTPGVFWAGGRQAIFESTDRRTFRRIHTMPVGFVNAFMQAPTGEWWAATSNAGILRRELATRGPWLPHEAVNARLEDLNVRDLAWRANGDVWIATAQGVTVLNAAHEEQPLDLPTDLTAGFAMFEARDGQMWVGGVGGIAVGDRGGWRVVTTADGLPGSTVYAMAQASDGTVWVGGSDGIARFSDGTWRRFGAGGGLISEESNSHGVLPRPDGDVLFGTMSGIAHFDSAVGLPVPPALRLYWRGAMLGQQGPLILPPDNRRLQLDWMAPWPRPVEVEYRTRIPSLRDEWSAPQVVPALRIENLGPGSLTVEVQARLPAGTGGDQDWSDALVASVVVQPLWWETRAATAAAGLLGVFAVVAVIRWRTSRLQKRAAALQAAVDDAMDKMKVLRGLLPICAHCKKIRDDQGQWSRVEEYIGRHSEANFSHGMCPDCEQEHYPGMTG